ncbi:UV-endonuclease UvdE [Lentithecium fluviatile CBS 122367]|uniref:UV-endonuclease UvdE n=1 Tax=Lentithecium fluviatile CBS 122367 TaxID=1168545 RepID=A0A6G1J8S8_9PLEO|nr:UV-endonuclease UvdE [Lentithecium fluviatile CBS 122367]
MLRFVLPFHLRARIAFRIQPRASPTRPCPPFVWPPPLTMASKRKRSTALPAVANAPSSNSNSNADPPRPRQRTAVPLPSNLTKVEPPPPRRQSLRAATSAITNLDVNPEVLDGLSALRASPDSGEVAGVGPAVKRRRDNKSLGAALSVNGGPGSQKATSAEAPASTEDISILSAPAPAEEHGRVPGRAKISGRGVQKNASIPSGPASETAPADLPDQQPGRSKRKTPMQHVKVDSAPANNTAVNPSLQHGSAPSGDALEKDVGVTVDPEVDRMLIGDNENEDEEDVKEALSRSPPVNSDYLPLPWKGRLGYACLNTYLRNANPPVFSSRTCRIASILEHRHPLKDPSQPEHATKNRPDKDQPSDIVRGQKYVKELGLANARDIAKMVRWNDRYGIKFMRLSSEMFPFASHEEYGYKLAPFAADTLAEVGKVIAELGHRITTHPGQFTQLGSPRKSVIDNAIRDLAYHDEMLSLLKLPPQQDRDAVMIMHLGGAFGDKPAAIDRFRENYARLPQGVKNRLVLENDDVVWSTHEILPLCQELNIPFVLDFHHHNILFDATQIREGTNDIVDLFPSILETWKRKNIAPKMHYSEPCPDAITNRSRRKHSPRVMTLPPCPDTMDLMIEAKDKEQAVFELMRTFKLPGFHLFNNIVPYVRQDENKLFKPKPKKATKGKKKKADKLEEADAKIEEEEEEKPLPVVPDDEVGMGGPEGRVYWPPGMEEWLRPMKRIVNKKEEGAATPAKKKRKTAAAATPAASNAPLNGEVNGVEDVETPAKKAAPKRAASSTKKKAVKAVPTPEPSEDEESPPLSDMDNEDDEIAPVVKKRGGVAPTVPTPKRSGRVSQKVSYKEEDAEMSV